MTCVKVFYCMFVCFLFLVFLSFIQVIALMKVSLITDTKHFHILFVAYNLSYISITQLLVQCHNTQVRLH